MAISKELVNVFCGNLTNSKYHYGFSSPNLSFRPFSRFFSPFGNPEKMLTLPMAELFKEGLQLNYKYLIIKHVEGVKFNSFINDLTLLLTQKLYFRIRGIQ